MGESWPGDTGAVAAIHVANGDWVEAGELLLELENDVLQGQVTVAEAAVREAEAALSKLKAGATLAEIAAARGRGRDGQSTGRCSWRRTVRGAIGSDDRAGAGGAGAGRLR
jgi:multidrug efflux pump subunit AcrA (membrane-fusion protein)